MSKRRQAKPIDDALIADGHSEAIWRASYVSLAIKRARAN